MSNNGRYMFHSADTGPGTWCPSTPGRERIASLDQIISEELARRLNLKSHRDAHPEQFPAPKVISRNRPSRAKVLPAAPVDDCAHCGKPLPPGCTGATCSTKCSKDRWRREAQAKGFLAKGSHKGGRMKVEGLTTHGLRLRAAKLSRKLMAEPGDRWTRTQLGECEAEFQRRAG
jgi:hypothetical protein